MNDKKYLKENGQNLDKYHISQEKILAYDFVKSLFTFLPYKQFKVYEEKASKLDSC